MLILHHFYHVKSATNSMNSWCLNRWVHAVKSSNGATFIYLICSMLLLGADNRFTSEFSNLETCGKRLYKLAIQAQETRSWRNDNELNTTTSNGSKFAHVFTMLEQSAHAKTWTHLHIRLGTCPDIFAHIGYLTCVQTQVQLENGIS